METVKPKKSTFSAFIRSIPNIQNGQQRWWSLTENKHYILYLDEDGSFLGFTVTEKGLHPLGDQRRSPTIKGARGDLNST